MVAVDPVTLQQGLAIWQAGDSVALIWQGPGIPGLQKEKADLRKHTKSKSTHVSLPASQDRLGLDSSLASGRLCKGQEV